MRHHPPWTHALFTDDDLDAIARAIAAAESLTSAEIRVHLDRRVPPAAADALTRARQVFMRAGMQRTAERNGVLIYLAIEDHQLAVIGDEGIHARVGAAYWERVRDLLVEQLRGRTPRDALLAAIGDVASVLRKFFPRRDDVNELSDRVSTE
jgi:uncharacterized membrane protein